MWVIDGTGNPAAAIADTGKTAYTVSYDPYGVESITADSASSSQWQQNPYGFKGGLRSSSTDNGLTKFGYRWQSSVIGGWIERDTLDAPLSPSNANRYAFAGSDPVNQADPTGRISAALFVSLLDAVLTGKDVYDLLSAQSTEEGLAAEFSLACGLIAGAVAAPTVAGTLVAIGGCAVATELFKNAL
jgi:RHS repeat-associated protein